MFIELTNDASDFELRGKKFLINIHYLEFYSLGNGKVRIVDNYVGRNLYVKETYEEIKQKIIDAGALKCP